MLISPDLGDLTFLDFAAAPKFVELGRSRRARAGRGSSPRYALPPEPTPRTRQRVSSCRRTATRRRSTSSRRGHRARPIPRARRRSSIRSSGKPFDSRQVDADLARLYGSGDFERIDLPADRREGPARARRSTSARSRGARTSCASASTVDRPAGRELLQPDGRPHERWINSLGAQWMQRDRVRAACAATRPSSTSRSSVGSTVFGSAYGAAQREPHYIFDGDRRVARIRHADRARGRRPRRVTLGDCGRDPRRAAVQRTTAPTARSPSAISVVGIAGTRPACRCSRATTGSTIRSSRATAFACNAEAVLGDPQACGGDTRRDARQRRVPAGAAALRQRRAASRRTLRRDAASDDADDRHQGFDLGGFLNLSGLRTDQLTGNYLGFARAVYYHRIGHAAAASAAASTSGGSLEAGNVWTDAQRRRFGDNLCKAGSVFLAADTYLGPFYFAYGRASAAASRAATFSLAGPDSASSATPTGSRAAARPSGIRARR